MKHISKQDYLKAWQLDWYIKKHRVALWLAFIAVVLIILWSGLA